MRASSMPVKHGATNWNSLSPSFGVTAVALPTVMVVSLGRCCPAHCGGPPLLSFCARRPWGRGGATGGGESRVSPADRAAIMRMLFDPRTGDGLSYLRQPIGASDFVATAPYTHDDVPAGQTDYPQRHFSITHDEAQILPLLRKAKRLNPQLQIV